jgi:DMSO/TMAO reductase YedYZ heme-binding membrane subunit
MSSQIWWYTARASGIVAWLFITASVLWGILLSTKLFPRQRRPAWILDLHRALGALSVVFVATHIGSLVADNYVHFGLADVTIPFVSGWRPWQVALGVFAFWLLILVESTSLLMKHLPRRVWRGIHLTSYVVFVLGSLHGTFAGTDSTNIVYVITSLVVTAAVVVAVCLRIVEQPAAGAERSRDRARRATIMR